MPKLNDQVGITVKVQGSDIILLEVRPQAAGNVADSH
jgi:hypothetical protein